MTQIKTDICYLCGDLLSLSDIDDDHVPPKNLYSKQTRATLKTSRLLTLPTHRACNASYQLDEQYFIHTFLPLAIGTDSANSLWNEIRDQYARGRNIPLRMRALAEFDPSPSGLVLPYGKVAKHFDPQRVWRVVWKIARGLYFHEFQTFLPDDRTRGFDLCGPDDKPPDQFSALAALTGLGSYPKVFDYKYVKLADPQMPDVLFMWAMLFWDRIIMITYFHDPTCKCTHCVT